jgi:diguanylate cyclase (GGDEF)-like protein
MRWGQKSERRAVTETLRRQATDEVTGLLTFPAFLHSCGEALMSFVARDNLAEPAVLLVDLDGLTVAVESEPDPHSAGDEVVRSLAARIVREVGSLGLVGRTSDHQIGVLFAHLTDPAVALDLAYRIVAAISSPVALGNRRRVQVSASCGLVARETLPGHATATDLIRGAGLAVHEARRHGRNLIEVCTPDLIVLADETLAISKDLRLALRQQGLRVCYQPLVNLADGTIMGFEALVRWSHPVHGQVSPSRFVLVAEQFGMLSELGRMVLSTATAQTQTWSSLFDLPLDVHVNVSGADLTSDTFLSVVSECLAESGLPSSRLVLEVTEGAVQPSLETARARFDALHEMGVRVALDDFTTGRSALAYMDSLSVDILKVDRFYLDSVGDDDGGGADDLLRGVIGLGLAMGMEVYGEGIENEEERTRMRQHGCDIGQGYLFARPLPPEEAAELLRDQADPADTVARRILAADSARTAS